MIELNIGKQDVLDEVDKTSAYLGSKTGDELSYRRIALTAASHEQLERYWTEGCAAVSLALSEWLVSQATGDGGYSVVLEPSLAWNSALLPALTAAVRSYLVTGIAAKWLMVAGAEAAQSYSTLAAGYLEQAIALLHQFLPPERN